MDFDQAYSAFIERHIASRTGERRGRLLRGHNFAEKLLLQHLWWPLFGNFDHLHPEYEVFDWNRKSQFIDLAFLPSSGQFGLECDGFQSHVKDMDREKFSYLLNRETFLTGMGWTMIHFSFDDVQHRPELCRMLLQHVIGPHLIRTTSPPLPPMEKELLRFAWNLGRPTRPRDVMQRFEVHFRTARKMLQGLVDKQLIRPVVKGTYIISYEPIEGSLYKML